ncbi:hypothetical protein DAPPUDRAFT_259247 [Daphnia pulex]|uniref:Uncharacterized protein n=1 Tax=Daphnia pulex TaxID=6669 RepID=E9HGY0_DAPPU|nr:hypothetical protein DAPPUDRAFT_259247 [Daphnia pulex]|eukprot:EFX68961.1 hypothetical protein DAPPUDRAFT_259247 [Daphnia pulex]
MNLQLGKPNVEQQNLKYSGLLALKLMLSGMLQHDQPSLKYSGVLDLKQKLSGQLQHDQLSLKNSGVLDLKQMLSGMQSPEKPSVLNRLLLDLLLLLFDLPPVYPTKHKMKLTIGDKVMQVFSDDLGKPVKPPKQNI